MSIQESKPNHAKRDNILACLFIAGLVTGFGVAIYFLAVDFFNQEAKRQEYISSLDTCYKLTSYIEDHNNEGYFYGKAGDAFKHMCIEPIFHKTYVDSAEVKSYLRDTSCENVKTWILDRFPYKEEATFEYQYRCNLTVNDSSPNTSKT